VATLAVLANEHFYVLAEGNRRCITGVDVAVKVFIVVEIAT